MKNCTSILLALTLLLVATLSHAAEPEPADLVCSQGEDCSKILVLKADGVAMNLTGYSYRAQIRASPADVAPLAELELDTSSLALGQINLLLPATLTTQLAGRTGYWDLRETDPSGQVSYPVRGKFKCYWSLTR